MVAAPSSPSLLSSSHPFHAIIVIQRHPKDRHPSDHTSERERERGEAWETRSKPSSHSPPSVILLLPPPPPKPPPLRWSSVSPSLIIPSPSTTAAAIAHMLYAPLVVPITTNTTGKLEISRLLGPSPSSPPHAFQGPPGNRSISVPTSTPLYPLVTSPTPSTASQVSTATAPANLYPPQERRTHGPSSLAAASLGSTVPPPGPNKRPSSGKPHPAASPAKKQSKWTAAEDAEVIQLRGAGKRWDEIASQLPGRSMTSCRLHYQNYLEKKCPWDEEKSNRLARLYDRYVL